MKKLFFLCLILVSFNTIAQKLVTYIKIERTPCYGRCPVYSLEIMSNGKIKYEGKRNVDKMGVYNYKVSPQKVKSLFAFIEKNKISSLKNKYEQVATDLPRLHMAFIIAKKTKKIQNAEAGPKYLEEIANRVDAVWNELNIDRSPIPYEEYPAVEPVVIQEQNVIPEPQIYSYVEQMPEYPGGEDMLEKYFKENLNYPAKEKEMGVEGRVICRFIVNEDGSLSDIKIVRSISEGCDEEAIRLIKYMPYWKPGKQNGKAVKVSYNLPIIFNLD
jgi:TonB family protein